MAVLIEGVSIVVPFKTIRTWHEGGIPSFFEWIEGFRYCHDGHLVAIHFTRAETVRKILAQLEERPLPLKNNSGAWDILAVVYQEFASALAPCDWLTIGCNFDGAVFACLKDQEKGPVKINVPDGWDFKGSLSQKIGYVPLNRFAKESKFLRSEGLSNIYLDLKAGLEVPAGRPMTSVERKCWMAGVPFPADHQEDRKKLVDDTSESAKDVERSKKDGKEIVMVRMGFADCHEIEEGSKEGDYFEEDVFAVNVGPNRYRLEENPIWTNMATFHDVVEGEIVDGYVFYVQRVVERSGLKTIRTGVPPYFYFSDFGKGFLDKVLEAGGMWDIAFWGILVFNIPEERAEEFEDLYAVACREARLVQRDATELPNDLYKKHPSGGCPTPEEEN